MKEIKEKYLKDIYLNILKAIIIITYFLVLNLAYENVNNQYLEIGIKAFTMIFLFLAIYIFEKAYKKDDDNLAVQGIEILVLSVYTLTSRHITNKFNFNFKSYSLVASYLFAIYFILKCIFIYTKGRREEAEDFSDIKEIVKKEEPVKKEATKKATEEQEEPKEIKKETKTSAKKSTAKKTTAKKTTAKTTKSTTEKKKATKKTTKSTTAKKTATKKTTKSATEKTSTKKTTKKENENNSKEDKPKRKQVKKEVKEND